MRLGLHQELHTLDSVHCLEGKCHIDVYDVAKTRARVAEAQSEAGVLEKPERGLG